MDSKLLADLKAVGITLDADLLLKALTPDAPAQVPFPSPPPYTPAAPALPTVGNSRKKGVGQWEFGGDQTVTCGASWYYNWSPHSHGGAAEFIPMIWGGRDDNDNGYKALAECKSSAMLACNEPDGGGQGHSNVRVDDAVRMWQRMVTVANGRRMGSPAVASSYTWLADFMSKVERKPDFIALHTYPNLRDVDQAVQSVVDLCIRIHQQYGLPVWLTETGVYGGGWGGGTWENAPIYAAKFASAMEKLDIVERFAWFFETGSYSGTEMSGIWDSDGSLTAVGKAYRDAK